MRSVLRLLKHLDFDRLAPRPRTACVLQNAALWPVSKSQRDVALRE